MKKSASNSNLTQAKNAKNDEFYTQYQDIEKEVMAYFEYNKDVFRGKTILLPCDDPEWSNFTKFFAQNFERLGLKKLISTSYAPDSKRYKYGYQPSLFEVNDAQFDETKTQIKGKIFTLTRDKSGKGKTNVKEKLFSYLDDLNSEGKVLPVFVLVLGDIADTGVASEFEQYKLLLDELSENYGIEKNYGIVGNHDLYNTGWLEWKKTVYPHKSFYTFETETFSWYFLDSGNGTLGSQQLNSFVTALKKDPKNKFVFIHYPLYRDDIFYFSLSDPRERAVLIDACAKYNVRAVFSGHDHYGSRFDYGPFEEIGVYSFVNNRNWSDGSWSILEIDETMGEYVYTQYR